KRRCDLSVAVLRGVHVEHELPERTFEPRQTLLEHHKPRARQFGGGLEVHLAERFAEFEMLLWGERKISLGAEAMMLDIVARIFAIGYVVERQIRNFSERSVQRL